MSISSQVTQQTESDLLCFAEEQAMGADKHRRTPRRSNRLFARGGAPDLPTAIVCPQAEAGAGGGQSSRLNQADPFCCCWTSAFFSVSGPSSPLAALPNIVTSWGGAPASPSGARPKRKTANYSSAQPARYCPWGVLRTFASFHFLEASPLHL